MPHAFAESDAPRPKPLRRAKLQATALAGANSGLPAQSDPIDDARGPDDEEMARIIGRIATGATEFRLLQWIGRTFPNVVPRQALAAAMARIAKNADNDPAVVMSWTFEAARRLYRKLLKDEQYAEALKVLKFINDTALKMGSLASTTDPRPDPDHVPEDKTDNDSDAASD